jgi:hypothetical protein
MRSDNVKPSAVAATSANSELTLGTGTEIPHGSAEIEPPRAAPRRLRPPAGGAPRVIADHPLLADLIAITVLALVVRVIFRQAEPDTDPTFALVWGREIIHGHLPDLAYAYAPTAHPLPLVEATLVAPLGISGAVSAWMVLSYWSMGALLWGVFRLGEAAFSRLTGVLALVLVATNFATLNVALGGFLDVQFLALVTWAAVLEVRMPRRGLSVLVLLTIAGLLRPEGGMLAGLYWVYAFYRRDHWLIAGVIVLIAPLGWVLMDVIVTGHPLFAFTNARHSAEGQALSNVGHSQLVSLAINQLRDAMRAPVLLGGALGLLLCARLRWRPAAVPGAIAAVVLLAYAVLLVLRLPVPDRMLLTPAVMLSLFCAFVAVGWVGRRPEGLQRLWTVGGAAIVVLLLATAPGEFSRLQDVNSRRAGLQQVIGDLRALNHSPAVTAALAACRSISMGRLEMTQYVAYYLDRPLSQIGVDGTGTPQRGAYFALATPRAGWAVLGHWETQTGLAVPSGLHRVALNRSWAVYTNGC